MKKTISLLTCLILLMTWIPFRANAQTADSKSIDDTVSEYAAELFKDTEGNYQYFNAENMPFRALMNKVFSGRQEDSSFIEKLWGNVKSLMIDNLTKLVTNETHSVVNPNQDMEEVSYYVELLQILVEYSQMSYDEVLKDSKGRFESLSTGEVLLSFAKDIIKIKMEAADECITTLRDLALPLFEYVMGIDELPDITAYQWIECLLCQNRHFQYVASSIDFFSSIAEKTDEPNLQNAAWALVTVYTEWQKELEELDYQEASLEDLLSGDFYRNKEKSWVSNRLQDYLEHEHGADGLFKLGRDVYAVARGLFLAPVEEVIFLGVGASDLAFNADSLYSATYAMKCLNYIAEAMERIGKEQIGNRRGDWQDFVSYANTYLLYLKLCAMGESNLYHMMTRPSIVGELFRSLDHTDYEDWYKRESKLLNDIYTNVQSNIGQIMDCYYECLQGGTDLSDLSDSENLTKQTIAGTLTQGEFFADRENPGKPDLDEPNSNQGKAAAGVSVELIGKESGTLYASTGTDEEGKYQLEYYQEAVEGEPLELVFAKRCSEDQFAVKHMDVWIHPEISFRSPWTSSATPSILSEETILQQVVDYCDQLFLQKPGEYHQETARLALGLCVAAFSSPTADTKWGEDGYFGRENNIREALSLLGCNEYPAEYHHYDVNLNDDSGKVAFAIAAKDIENPAISYLEDEERKEHAVFVVLRGGGYGAEWSNNFRVGGGDRKHKGFSDAADDVAAATLNYIRNTFQDNRPVKVLLTGYSRAAAVANLASVQLGAQLEIKTLYTYTFATPSGTMNPQPVRGVFNLVYEEDPVPRLAPGKWGFGKYGETKVFSAARSGMTKKMAERVNRRFQRITKYSGAGYNPLDYVAGSQLIDTAVSAMLKVAPDTETFTTVLQPYVMGITQAAFTAMVDQKGNKVSGMELLKYVNDRMTERIAETYPEYQDEIQKFRAELQKTKELPAFSLLEKLFINASLVGRNNIILRCLTDLYLIFDRPGMKLLTRLWNEQAGPVIEMIFHILITARIEKSGEFSLENLGEGVADALIQIFLGIFQWGGLLDDLFQTNATFSDVFMGHNPEVYMSWLLALSGKEMFGENTVLQFDYPLLPVKTDPRGTASLSYTENGDYTMANGLLPEDARIFGSLTGDRWYIIRHYFDEVTDLMIALPAELVPEGKTWKDVSITDEDVAGWMDRYPWMPVTRSPLLVEDGEYKYPDTIQGMEFREKDRRDMYWITGLDGKLYLWLTDIYNPYMGPEGKWMDSWFFVREPDKTEMQSIHPSMEFLKGGPSEVLDWYGTASHVIPGVIENIWLKYDDKSGLWCLSATLSAYNREFHVYNAIENRFTFDHGEIVPVVRIVMGEETERYFPQENN